MVIYTYKVLTPTTYLINEQETSKEDVHKYDLYNGPVVKCEQFLEEFKDIVDWDRVDYSPKFVRLSFIEKMSEYVDWSKVLLFRRDIPEQLIRDNLQRIRLSDVRQQSVSIDFIREFARDLYWPDLLKNIQFSEAELREFIIYYNIYAWRSIASYQKLSMSFIRDFIHDLSDDCRTLLKKQVIDEKFILDNMSIFREYEPYNSGKMSMST